MSVCVRGGSNGAKSRTDMEKVTVIIARHVHFMLKMKPKTETVLKLVT